MYLSADLMVLRSIITSTEGDDKRQVHLIDANFTLGEQGGYAIDALMGAGDFHKSWAWDQKGRGFLHSDMSALSFSCVCACLSVCVCVIIWILLISPIDLHKEAFRTKAVRTKGDFFPGTFDFLCLYSRFLKIHIGLPAPLSLPTPSLPSSRQTFFYGFITLKPQLSKIFEEDRVGG